MHFQDVSVILTQHSPFPEERLAKNITLNFTHSVFMKSNEYTRTRQFSMKILGEQNNPNAIKDFIRYIEEEFKVLVSTS